MIQNHPFSATWRTVMFQQRFNLSGPQVPHLYNEVASEVERISGVTESCLQLFSTSPRICKHSQREDDYSNYFKDE